MSVSITVNDIHPAEIRRAVADTVLANDMEFERVLMRMFRPPMMLRPMPNVSSISMTINMVYKDTTVNITIVPRSA